jgi:hypothetical protein
MTKTLTPKELAAQFETDARTVRKFLRKDARDNGTETPGKGSRWEIEAKSVRSLRKRFDSWIAANAEKATEAPDES